MQWFNCCHCKKLKPENEFYKDRQKPSGYKPRCKTCENLYKNYKARREYEKKYRKEYPEKRRKILRSWYIKNKENYKKTLKKYRQTDSFKKNHRKHGATRRAREKNAFVESVDYSKLYTGVCFYCGDEISFNKTEFDHFIPLSKGGKHEVGNIVCSCQTCNRKKGNIVPQEVNYQVV